MFKLQIVERVQDGMPSVKSSGRALGETSDVTSRLASSAAMEHQNYTCSWHIQRLSPSRPRETLGTEKLTIIYLDDVRAWTSSRIGDHLEHTATSARQRSNRFNNCNTRTPWTSRTRLLRELHSFVEACWVRMLLITRNQSIDMMHLLKPPARRPARARTCISERATHSDFKKPPARRISPHYANWQTKNDE